MSLRMSGTAAAAPMVLAGTVPTTVVETIKGAVGQSADLEDWEDSTGRVLAKVSASGAFTNAVSGTGPVLVFDSSAAPGTGTDNCPIFRVLNTTVGSAKSQFVLGGATSARQWSFGCDINGVNEQRFHLYDAAGNACRLSIDSSGNTVLGQFSAYAPTALASLDVRGHAFVTNGGAANIGLTVQGAASQSGDLQQWQDSTGIPLAKVDAGGNIHGGHVRIYASGTATVPGSATSVTVSHGLTTTPSINDIAVTPQTNLSSGAASHFWVGAVTSTQFTINVDVVPGSPLNFSWQASVPS